MRGWICTVSLVLIVVTSLNCPAMARPQLETPVLMHRDFSQLRATTNLRTLDDQYRRDTDAQIFDALARRGGYVGDRSYLQGCDITSLPASKTYHLTRLALTAENFDQFLQFQALVEADVTDFPTPPSDTEDLSVDADRRYEADQAARERLNAPLGDYPEALADAALDARISRMCEIDLQNGEWLKRASVKTLFLETDDPKVASEIANLALHADHLPEIQDEYAAMTFARGSSNRPPEIGMRLKDRSLINLGRPQLYGTGVICVEGKPEFAGGKTADQMSLLRQVMQLPPVDLQVLTQNSFCGT